MLVKNLILSIRKKLQSANISDTSSLEADLIVMHSLGILNRERLITSYEQHVNEYQITICNEFTERRIRHEPIAYIIGKKSFWDDDFMVNKDVLIPRPETELIIEAVLNDFYDITAPLKIIDLGTGSGCIPITLLKLYAHAHATAVDLSPEALKIAEQNAIKLGVIDRISLVHSNWFHMIKSDQKFDIIVSNPPYIPLHDMKSLDKNVLSYEPKIALTDFADGLSHYREILGQAYKHMSDNGKIFFEIGIKQSKDLSDLAQHYNLLVERLINDLSGIPRIIVCSRSI